MFSQLYCIYRLTWISTKDIILIELWYVISNNVVLWHVWTQTSLCSLLLSLETPNDVQSVAEESLNIQATSKGSYQTAHMHRLVWAFVGAHTLLLEILWHNSITLSGLQIRKRNWKLFSYFLNQNLCCGCSKELSQWDGSVEHPKHMFKLMGEKIITLLNSKCFLIWNYDYQISITVFGWLLAEDTRIL